MSATRSTTRAATKTAPAVRRENPLEMFVWQGTDKRGVKMKGEQSAKNANLLRAELRRQGITPDVVKPKGKPLFGASGKRITPGDIAIFSRQIATMMKSGVPIVTSLEIIGEGHKNPRMKKLLNAIRADLESGLSRDEGVEIARTLAASGKFDFLNIIRGHIETDAALTEVIPITGMRSAPHLDFAGDVRAATQVPVFHAARIADVATARHAIASGKLDMVGMTRPHIAEPHIVAKVASGNEHRIRPCVGATYCLDRIYEGGEALCIHNAATGREASIPHVIAKAEGPAKKVVVVGAGPAGLAFAVNAAARGHQVTLFDALPEIGGQFNIAKQIPGKEEFHETLRYYRTMLDLNGVDLRLNTRVTADDLLAFDETILATGIAPRLPAIAGIDHPKVLSYLDVLRDKAPVGAKVAIIGCGGIGFDTAMYLSQSGVATSQDIGEFCREWGIDTSLQTAGGLRPEGPQLSQSPRQIVMLQRKVSKPGEGLGKTTGWIHRATLLARGVKMIPAVSYEKIDDEGLHVTIGGERQLLAVDHVIVCAGQEPRRELAEPLRAAGKTVHLIGGCDVAAELDARRAIAQGTKLALTI